MEANQNQIIESLANELVFQLNNKRIYQQKCAKTHKMLISFMSTLDPLDPEYDSYDGYPCKQIHEKQYEGTCSFFVLMAIVVLANKKILFPDRENPLEAIQVHQWIEKTLLQIQIQHVRLKFPIQRFLDLFTPSWWIVFLRKTSGWIHLTILKGHNNRPKPDIDRTMEDEADMDMEPPQYQVFDDKALHLETDIDRTMEGEPDMDMEPPQYQAFDHKALYLFEDTLRFLVCGQERERWTIPLLKENWMDQFWTQSFIEKMKEKYKSPYSTDHPVRQQQWWFEPCVDPCKWKEVWLTPKALASDENDDLPQWVDRKTWMENRKKVKL